MWHYGYHPKLNRFELLPFFHLYLTSRAKDTALLHFAVSRQTKALIYSFRIQKKKSPSSSLLHYEDDTLLVSTISYCPEHNRSFIFRQRSKRWDNVKPCNKLDRESSMILGAKIQFFSNFQRGKNPRNIYFQIEITCDLS